MADLMDEAIEISHKLIPCNICGRTFLPSPLKKHAKVCEKNATRKRKTFNSLKQRIEGTELAVFHQKSFLRKNDHVTTHAPQQQLQQQQQQLQQQQTQQQPVLSSFQNPNAIYGTLRGNQTNTNTNTIYAQPSQLSQLVAGGSPSAIRRATTSANRSQSAERKIIGEGPGGVGSGFIAALSAKLHPSLSPRNSRRHSEDLGPQCSNISQPQPKIIQRGPGQGFLDTLNAKLAQQHLTNSQGQLKANKIRQIINSKAQPDPTTCHESLMDQIKRGATLKKARGVNDRSAPKIY